jgi:hypothetical protein
VKNDDRHDELRKVVHVLQPEITESFDRELAAPPKEAQAALTHLDPLHTLVTALEAFGLGSRLLTSRRASEDGTHVYSLVVRLGDAPVPSHVELVWRVAVEPYGADGSLISVDVEAAATDSASSRTLLDGWPLLGPLAADRARHILAGIADYDVDEDVREAVVA